MNVMSAKLEKDLRNSVNRRLNCDSANLDKSVEAAQEQMEAIRRLQAAELLEQLPDKLQETAALRAQEIAREAEAESRRQREQAEQHLDETAEFIVERVVKH